MSTEIKAGMKVQRPKSSRRNRLFGFLDGYTIRALVATNVTAKKVVRSCTECGQPIAVGERYRFKSERNTASVTRDYRQCGACIRVDIVGEDAFIAQRRAQDRGQEFATRVYFTILREAGASHHRGGSCNKVRPVNDRCTSCDAWHDFMSRPLAEVEARI
jgi:hypothetical protein